MATSVSSTPKESTLLKETEVQDRSRSEMLVTKSATSEPQLKMPHTTTKTKSVDDILEIISATKSITSKMPLARSASTKAGTSGGGPPTSPTMLSSPNPPSQRPVLNRRASSNSSFTSAASANSMNGSRSSRPRGTKHSASRSVSFSNGHSLGSITSDGSQNNKSTTTRRSSSMNPNASSLHCSPGAHPSPNGNINNKQLKDQTDRPYVESNEAKDLSIKDLGISSPISNGGAPPEAKNLFPDSHSSGAQLESTTPAELALAPASASASVLTPSSASMPTSTRHSSTPSTAQNVVDFDPEEFRENLIRQISDKLETGLDKHFSQLVSVANTSNSAALVNSSSSIATATDAEAAMSSSVVAQLKNTLRTTTADLNNLKSKHQDLQEENHKLKLQCLDASHKASRLESLELNNQLLLARVKELEFNGGLSSPLDSETCGADTMETTSTGSRHNPTYRLSPQHVQQLMREVASLSSERDTLKIRIWELEKKPFAHQKHIRSQDFIDLENERNRLIEELGVKTVALEEQFNRNEALMVRAKEYEKRVWELENQCSVLEAECSSVSLLRAELSDKRSNVVDADVHAIKLQELEAQQVLVKSLQARVQELETTNAELDHSNWDLSERLNIANNQHALLTKEFELFRSKDKDDRKLEFLASRNRELEALLAEQAKLSPNYKEEYDRLSTDYEKIKIRLPQLEGQSKQVALLRAKTLQLEKQIKTMEQLEPRLEEMQRLHERNVFLEGELGELELLRAREMELESALEESKTRLAQLEASKSRVASLSGIKNLHTRGRSGSVAGQAPPRPSSIASQGLPPVMSGPTSDDSAKSENETLDGVNSRSSSTTRMASRHRGMSSSSFDMASIGASVMAKQNSSGPVASIWPSGRSSMSLSATSSNFSDATNSADTTAASSVLNNKSPPTDEPESTVLPDAPCAETLQ